MAITFPGEPSVHGNELSREPEILSLPPSLLRVSLMVTALPFLFGLMTTVAPRSTL